MERNIRELYQALTLDNRKKLITALAQDFDMNPHSIRNFWLAPEPQIPTAKIERVLQILQNAVKAQITSNEKLLT